MNRHQRRASKHREKQEKRSQLGPDQSADSTDFWSKAPQISNFDINQTVVGHGAQAPQTAQPTHGTVTQKSSWAARLFSRMLLSSWVLDRVSNPEVEKLLMSIAVETGHIEAADKIVRRQALRKARSKI